MLSGAIASPRPSFPSTTQFMMILRTLPLLLVLLIRAVAAFQNTSPFFYFTTSQLSPLAATNRNIISAEDLQKQLTDSLQACPSDTYILVSQPGVSISDYAEWDSAPHLRRRLKGESYGEKIKSKGLVPEVVGSLDEDAIIELLKDKCGAGVVDLEASTRYFRFGESSPSAIRVRFAPLPSSREGRAEKLLENDSFLHAIMSSLEKPSYTVIISTTNILDVDPSASDLFEPTIDLSQEFADSVHQELKRDFSSHVRRANDNDSSTDNLALFEKYQFFTPGIFMGLSVVLLLSFIAYVGISAISGLDVSYGAFKKEGGPQAQKKQQ